MQNSLRVIVRQELAAADRFARERAESASREPRAPNTGARQAYPDKAAHIFQKLGTLEVAPARSCGRRSVGISTHPLLHPACSWLAMTVIRVSFRHDEGTLRLRADVILQKTSRQRFCRGCSLEAPSPPDW